MPLLTTEGLTVRFGGLTAVDDVSFAVREGSIHALIGPNGAGKSTIFNCISRLVQPLAGSIRMRGRQLLALPPSKVIRLGIARTFQNLELCRQLTVLDNVLTGGHRHATAGALAAAMRLPSTRRDEKRARERAEAAMALTGILAHGAAFCHGLPYGVLKRVELARALASDPQLLLLDEPAAGLNRQEREELAEVLLAVRAGGVTILMVEHDTRLVMRMSDHVTVLHFGRCIADGTPAAVQANPDVVAAYLGGGAAGDIGEAPQARPSHRRKGGNAVCSGSKT